jgi:hypothetical protein
MPHFGHISTTADALPGVKGELVSDDKSDARDADRGDSIWLSPHYGPPTETYEGSTTAPTTTAHECRSPRRTPARRSEAAANQRLVAIHNRSFPAIAARLHAAFDRSHAGRSRNSSQNRAPKNPCCGPVLRTAARPTRPPQARCHRRLTPTARDILPPKDRESIRARRRACLRGPVPPAVPPHVAHVAASCVLAASLAHWPNGRKGRDRRQDSRGRAARGP